MNVGVDCLYVQFIVLLVLTRSLNQYTFQKHVLYHFIHITSKTKYTSSIEFVAAQVCGYSNWCTSQVRLLKNLEFSHPGVSISFNNLEFMLVATIQAWKASKTLGCRLVFTRCSHVLPTFPHTLQCHKRMQLVTLVAQSSECSSSFQL